MEETSPDELYSKERFQKQQRRIPKVAKSSCRSSKEQFQTYQVVEKNE